MVSALINFLFALFLIGLVLIIASNLWALIVCLQAGVPLSYLKIPNWELIKAIFNNASSLMTFAFGLVLFTLILNIAFKGGSFLQSGKTMDKYQKLSYLHLQGNFERKRGLNRIQYDDKGNITRNTLEVFLEYIFGWAIRLQNKYADEFNLPLYKRWNIQKATNFRQEGVRIQGLDVYGKESRETKEDDNENRIRVKF